MYGGGGYFLDDFFYDVCDERGLLIWHDFMFACASYELTDDFEENISAEIRQNMRRLRSPCKYCSMVRKQRDGNPVRNAGMAEI